MSDIDPSPAIPADGFRYDNSGSITRPVNLDTFPAVGRVYPAISYDAGPRPEPEPDLCVIVPADGR